MNMDGLFISIDVVLECVQAAMTHVQNAFAQVQQGQVGAAGVQMHHVYHNLHNAEDRLYEILEHQNDAKMPPTSHRIDVAATMTLQPKTSNVNWAQCAIVGGYLIFAFYLWRSKPDRTDVCQENSADNAGVEGTPAVESSPPMELSEENDVGNLDGDELLDTQDLNASELFDTSISVDQLITLVNLVGRTLVYLQEPTVLAWILAGPILTYIKGYLTQQNHHGTVENYSTSYWMELGQYPEVQSCDVFGFGD